MSRKVGINLSSWDDYTFRVSKEFDLSDHYSDEEWAEMDSIEREDIIHDLAQEMIQESIMYDWDWITDGED